MITQTKYSNVFEDWSNCDIRDMRGRLLKSVCSKEQANEFLKEHFSDYFACDVRVEFNGCIGYIFRAE